MTPEESKDILKLWGRIGVGLLIIILFAFAIDKCKSSESKRSYYESQEDDFDMQPVQKP